MQQIVGQLIFGGEADFYGEDRAELARLHRRLAATMVYVTHDQEEALTLGTRVAVMNEGRVEQVGPPLEVYRRPANTYAAEFFGTANLFRGTVLAHMKEHSAVRHEGTGATLFAQPAPEATPVATTPSSTVPLGQSSRVVRTTW